MTRNSKAMGLALLSAFALAVLGAQSSWAAVNHSFTSNSGTGSTVLTGTTEVGTSEIFNLTGNPISCTDVSYKGTVVGNVADHVSVVPDYSKSHCTFSGVKVDVDNTGCTFTFDSDTNPNTTHFAAPAEHANVSVICNHPDDVNTHIVVTGPGCNVTVGTTHLPNVVVNHNLPGITYTVLPNHPGGAAITVNATVKTIKATTSGANCGALGLGNPGTHSLGTYTGKAIVTCYTDTDATTKNPHTEVLGEGAQVNCGLSTP